MSELRQYLETMLKADVQKIIISNPFGKSEEYKKIIIENKPCHEIAFTQTVK